MLHYSIKKFFEKCFSKNFFEKWTRGSMRPGDSGPCVPEINSCKQDSCWDRENYSPKRTDQCIIFWYALYVCVCVWHACARTPARLFAIIAYEASKWHVVSQMQWWQSLHIVLRAFARGLKEQFKNNSKTIHTQLSHTTWPQNDMSYRTCHEMSIT